MPGWKLLLSLAVLMPLVAYVAGTLASGSDGPARPTPVILEQSGGGPGDQGDPADPAPSPTRGDNGSGDDEDDGGEDEDRGPVVVTPRPTGLEDDETAGGDDDGDDAGNDTGADTESATD